ncbi:MAG TPA: SDR family NAD(P)-dependent oxidoreductase [Bryobacteraceae bacterium]|nr:SDR family NAD(P)-dependent oxidoreductase [Bryobacteraceae bacterium]
MPGELANCIAGRIANAFNFRGPNFVTDAACASAMAAINAAVEGLVANDFDAAITGGVDRNMGPSSFVKFCKIGALSATGTRPYAEGADGFVMGEGSAVFLLKRLADAERDGDKIYAVLRGIGGSSDGKGKGITAPNPIGQRLAIERAWQNAGLSPGTTTLMEGHGTSTRVGDVVEVQSMTEVLDGCHLAPGSVALGSVKSNIGHLKSAAGAAGLLKVALALRDKVLPPSVNCERKNPDIDFGRCPLYVNTELKPWTATADGVRRAGVSAFGFGGTNFHVVMEEHIPHRLTGNGKRSVAIGEKPMAGQAAPPAPSSGLSAKAPLRGALVMGSDSAANLAERLREAHKAAESGQAPVPAAPAEGDLHAPERVAIDYGDAAELADKSAKALKALEVNQTAMWKALRAQGIFRGSGAAPKVAFLYTGQGSQYVNMLRPLCGAEPIVAETFAEADGVMKPLLGKPLSEFVFVHDGDATAIAKAEEDLRQTAITQPAVLAADLALTRLLAAYGIEPDMTMGHSLGEYGALVASGALPFTDALEAVSARGREMTRVSLADNGRMAAVFAPLGEIERILATIDGYAVIANINSDRQAVIGGASKTIERAMKAFEEAGYNVVGLPVSHAFHTSIVAPASGPLREVLERLHLQSPRIPIVANVSGQFYPMGAGVVPQMLDILAAQIASPVQFVKGLRTLYASGARVFVEVGPKKALQGFAEDVLGGCGDVISLFTNHPKVGDTAAFNQALCGLYSAGLGRANAASRGAAVHADTPADAVSSSANAGVPPVLPQAPPVQAIPGPAASANGRYEELGRWFADVLDRGWEMYHGKNGAPAALPVVITGAAVGLPGTKRIFDDGNIARILRGEQFIDTVPTRFRRGMLDKHITRLVKTDNGGPVFESINSQADVIKLAARGGAFDLEHEFGIAAERVAALDRTTCLAIAAGIDAMRDAGIPLVMRYKTTSKGTQLPDRWGLPDAMRDDTGVIFASAFPGLNAFAEETSGYYTDRARREQLAMLESLLARLAEGDGRSILHQEMERRIGELRAEIEAKPYGLDRRFLLRTLPMGHSQFAEHIGARGPNTQINAACASTAQGIALAQDWIRAGRCRRAIIISADDVTSDQLIEWFGAGFLASGAAATDEVVEEAATPFDRRRHGMIVGMGAAALVVERADAVRERGIQPLCEVLGAVTANSAYHGTRLDVPHISRVMEELVTEAEQRGGIRRGQVAPQMVFVSHETYTPARGGSASAEIHALRHVFGDAADRIVIANTKGFTGHPMAAGIEDVVAVKALETGCVPPVANFKEVDPELGPLNLSKGGAYPVEYALRLGAGFGSQISMTLLRRVATNDGARPKPNALGYAYRIADQTAWHEWLGKMAGQPAANLEVVNRTLRVRDRGTSKQVVEAVQEAHAAPAPPAPVAAPVPMPPQRVAVNIPAAGPPAPAAKPEVAPQADAVKERVLALVAEKTGYPVDMLDLDLDLEADLGVDTVKQAEVMASIREAYGIARDDNMRLRDFPTLAHVIRFVYAKRPDLAGVPVPQAAGPSASVAPPLPVAVGPSAGDPVRERVLAIVAEKTGYPRDMLDLDLDLEADLGVDTVKQAEMMATIREAYGIARDDTIKLRDFPTLAHVIRFVYAKRPDLAVPATPPSAGPIAPATAEPVAPAAEPPAAEAPPLVGDPIQETVLAIVAEKTGYPKDMLDLDLDLEADLGIDTVKQAEMFASVRAAFRIPRDENLKLRDFPTLARVIQFARERQPQQKKPPAQATSPVAAASELAVAASGTTALAGLEAANAVPRRAPAPALRPPLHLCKPTGVTLGPASRVVLMPDQDAVGDALTERLRAMGVEVLTLRQGSDSDEVANALQKWLATGPVQGVYWLPALHHEGDVRAMDPATWHEALRVRAKLLYTTARVLYQQIANTNTFLVSATRLGGQHGYDDAGAVAPMGGAVAGFAKAYKRERMDALVKVVDVETGLGASDIAALLIEETLRDPGAVEIGYKAGQRWTVGLEAQPAADGRPGFKLDKDTVFVITGAAGGIVSAITADLAAASGGTFYLLDLVPEPPADHPDLKRFVNDKEGLKVDLAKRIRERGERGTPVQVEKELQNLERALAARNAVDAVRAAGGTAHYFSVDLTNADAVGEIIRQVRERSGRIDVLLHAAGIERSRLLPDKDPREFDLVFDVKSDGWFNLMRAIGDMPLGATVAFSSIAGRFGNGGQVDYSAANDLLCKLTSNLRTTRPGTRAIAVDWTAWGGIGMASRGSIPKMMELAGIDMLPPEAGVPVIRRELTAGGTRGEVVIAQRLGIMANEWDSTGGLDLAVAAEYARSQGPMVGEITRMSLQDGLRIETTLDPAVQPFLYDHQIDGTPVLPGVMGIEAFAEAALSMLPGWHIDAIEDVNFLAPFKFYRNEPRCVTVQAVFRPDGAAVVAECQLIGRRTLPNQAEPQATVHFTARVRLTEQAPVSVAALAPGTPVGSIVEAADVYRIYFHGPAYRVVNEAWSDGQRVIARMTQGLPSNHVPPERPTSAAPRLVELCFQAAGLWGLATEGKMGLPLHVDQVSLWREPGLADGPLFAVVATHGAGANFDADVVDAAGNLYLQLNGYRVVELPGVVDAAALRRLVPALVSEHHMAAAD